MPQSNEVLHIYTMTIQDLQNFLARVQIALDERFGKNANKEVSVLSGMTKLTEEVWELAEQVMIWKWRQDTRKWVYNPDALWAEVADVIFSVCMIAQALDIDIEQAIQMKKKKIEEKFGMENI